ncbi:MAG: hypothetical protein DI598_03345 [Pseudopedobacter saltans]|uniref:Gingipain domain-containing protein n=1 Tax=Pseudopedobacter saltans TaxID=151895 RepID=A0A2W5FAV9_9SPHI|nr:MAG: hypothetical protein DI598_03345 [Pseudopedobacter saltans]
MKRFIKILFFVFLSGYCFVGTAQQYNNEWIDYSKTYYKFKVGTTGLYRITYATLQSLGLSTTPANQFQLWRNGQVVPIYLSNTDENTAMSSSDYIEFWGKQNDGQPDSMLYRNKSAQLDKYYSLETDSATFFLTVNSTTSQNLHYQKVSNSVPAGATPEAYCWGLWETHFHNAVNPGMANFAYGDPIYSSSYDIGEGWVSDDINSGTSKTAEGSFLQVYTSGPSATLKVGVVGRSTLGQQRTVSLLLNSTTLESQRIDGLNAGTFNISISDLSKISDRNIFEVTHSIPTPNNNDRVAISYITLQFPRMWNFGDATLFGFSMDAKATSSYIAISGYSAKSFTPILYDITNAIRYTGTVQGGNIQYYVNPSNTKRDFIFIGQDNQSSNVSSIVSRKFVDYKVSGQGDFLMITGAALRTDDDPVAKYQAYRNSAAGGGYNAQIYDMGQLEDQFSFGIRMHPLSVKNFLRYARNTFSQKPKYVLLLGHGLTYNEYYYNQSSTNINRFAIIPTFGQPASDNLLASDGYDAVPATPIGRLSTISTTEITNYLSKLQEYESQQQSSVQTIDNKAWMKTAVHIAGGSDDNQSGDFIRYLKAVQDVISDSLMGYTVYNFNKITNNSTASLNNVLLRSLFKSGIGLINYWGHASSTTLDYNLDDPSNYGNVGKYPSFYVSGCDLFQATFTYNETRLSKLYTVPENYVFSPSVGSINFIAQSYLGVVSYLSNYNTPFYKSLDKDNYGQPMSISLATAAKTVIGSAPIDGTSSTDTLTRNAQVEQITLLGDPAIKVNSFSKPDFAIEDASVIVSPSYIDISQSKFHVKAYINNLGKATGDSLLIQIRHLHPNGSSDVIYYKNIAAVRYRDSIELDVPINAAIDAGQNTLAFSLDPLNKYDELSKTNNVLNKSVFIYTVGLSPIFPYNYSIVNKQNIKLIASTANPIATSTQYVMEIDTTALFNSSFKNRQTLTSSGGVLEFSPGVTFQDSTVYYWRVSDVPANGSDYHWNQASFLYLAKATYGGYNQSHLYQHFGSDLNRIQLDSTSRVWSFLGNPQLFELKTGVFSVSSSQYNDFSIAVNTNNITAFHCNWGDGLVFNLFDPKTFKPYYNQAQPSLTKNNGEGLFMGSQSSLPADCATQGSTQTNLTTNFEFYSSSYNDRALASQFMDWIPNGTFVAVRFFPNLYNSSPRIPDWKADPTANSLYNNLVNAGFTTIDNAAYPHNWAFIYQKKNGTFTPITIITANASDQVNYTTTINTPDSLGYVTSPKFGPSKGWHTMEWQGKTIDPGAGDKADIDLFGIDNAGNSTYLRTISMSQTSNDISNINAATYPYLQMRMRNADSTYETPYQLKYWRLFYDPIPEGALAANVYYQSDKDTLNKGADYKFAIAFKNISDTKFEDSIKVNYTLTDKNNVAHLVSLPRLKALEPGDTALIKVSIPGLATTGDINTTNYTGMNSQYLDVNPDNDQPEYTHVNNFLGKPLMINGDDGNASLDITFDGLHILNNDIVSSTPKIIAKLLSDSKSQLLRDTSLLTVYLKYPDGTLKRFKYGTDTLMFTQAKDSANNFALANFGPFLTQDGTYQLIIQGKSSTEADKTAQYSVSFQVYNKPMISDMFNYPNPFTTSTAFVFTLTGSVIPQNIRIEILTITGKIVKEITKAELGPLHIGRNITEYKWDGTDQYGQKLANGVYIYRVITNLDGKKLDHFNVSDDANTGQYFNKGYGKMYLMR